MQCTFNREVLFGTLLGGCFREVTFLYRFAIRLVSLYNHHGPGKSGLNMEVASFERLKVNGVDSL